MKWPVLLMLALAACGTARRSEPLGNAPRLVTRQQRHGERVFMEFCNQCHPGGDAGLAPAINNKPSPKMFMKLRVRKGLGRMPAFSDRVIDARAMDALMSYIIALRNA